MKLLSTRVQKISTNASDQNEDVFRIKTKPHVQCKSSSNALHWETAQSAARRMLGRLQSSSTITQNKTTKQNPSQAIYATNTL